LRLRRLVLPGVPARRPRHDRRPGRDIRLGRRFGGRHRRTRRLDLDQHIRMSPATPARKEEPMSVDTKLPDESQPAARLSLPWWTRGDTNAFFGLSFNILVNVLALTTLSVAVVHIPGGDVLGTVLPALGLALVLGNL